MRVINLEVENIKRVRAVQITPQEDVVTVAGKNEQGKSSVLDSIMYALGGKKALDERPLRNGAKKGKVVVDLGDYRVTRTFTRVGGGSLRVESANGIPARSPQKLLDSFLADMTFNPLAFADADPKAQAEMLMAVSRIPVNLKQIEELSGIKGIAEEDSAIEVFKDVHDALYGCRTDVGRDLTRAKRVLEDMGPVESVEPVSLSELLAVRQAMYDKQQAQKGARDGLASLEDKKNSLKEEMARTEADLIETERLLEKYQAEIAGFEVIDLSEIDAKIASSETINKQHDAYIRRCEKADEVKQHQDAYDGYTRRLEELAAAKETAIADAEMPIAGLGFDDDGYVTFEGVPLSQRGTSKKLLVGCAVGAALNPKLRVILVKEGDKFDSDNMAVLKSWAALNDYQIWLERVADSASGVSFFIEDGQLKGNGIAW